MFRLKIRVYSLLMLLPFASFVHAATLSDIKFAELPGERAEVRLTFDSPPTSPTGYAIEQPARVVLDFTGVENSLDQKKFSMNVGEVNSAVGGRGRWSYAANCQSR